MWLEPGTFKLIEAQVSPGNGGTDGRGGHSDQGQHREYLEAVYISRRSKIKLEIISFILSLSNLV